MEYSGTLLHKKILELSEMSTHVLVKLLFIAKHREVDKGEIILRRGQICRSVFFIEKGILRVFVNKDDLEFNTDFIFEGNFATNLKSLTSETASDATIIAEEETAVYEFNKSQLLALYKESPEIESFGRKLLEQLLIAQEEHTNLFKIYSPAQRYRYIVKHKPELLQRISLSKLSSYLGVARETLSRIRRGKS